MLRKDTIEFLDLGLISFEDSRKKQEELIEKRQKGLIKDTVIFCEHPSTLSLGKRLKEEDLLHSIEKYKEMGLEVIRTERGGGITYHGPGQLMIYPIISLREKGLGVRKFVEQGLDLLVNVLSKIGADAKVDLGKTGIWMSDKNGEQSKVAFCGLRIEHGVSNHGFSLNVNPDLEIFSEFIPCGEKGLEVTSIENLATMQSVKEQLKQEIISSWG